MFFTFNIMPMGIMLNEAMNEARIRDYPIPVLGMGVVPGRMGSVPSNVFYI